MNTNNNTITIQIPVEDYNAAAVKAAAEGKTFEQWVVAEVMKKARKEK